MLFQISYYLVDEFSHIWKEDSILDERSSWMIEAAIIKSVPFHEVLQVLSNATNLESEIQFVWEQNSLKVDASVKMSLYLSAR